MQGQHTYSEITSQPRAWEAALQAFKGIQTDVTRQWAARKPAQTLFIGCGSTHYLSQSAAAVFQTLTGMPARACPASELIFNPAQILSTPAETLLVTISRSGTTTETLVAADRFRQAGGGAVWTISCYPDSELVQGSDLALLAEAAQEQSIAQTRSFSSMLVLAQALAATIAGQDLTLFDQLPAMADRLLEQSAELVERLGRQNEIARFFFLGSGLRYGLANEVMLKMKEMSLTYSEAYHFLEFRHGPMSMANARSLVVGLLSDAARAHETQVLNDMAGLEAQILAVNADPEAGFEQGIPFPPGLPAWLAPSLYLPPLQLLAYYRAVGKGLDPDRPHNLEAVVQLDPASFDGGSDR